jgi:hypothetical protein
MKLWGNVDSGRWGEPAPPITVIVLLAATVSSAAGIAVYRYAQVWTPLQRQYLWPYIWSGLGVTTTGSYDLLYVVDGEGTRLALDDELVTVTAANGQTSFALSEAVALGGATRLEWKPDPYPHAALHRFFRRAIYHEQTVFELAQPALWGAVAVFLGGIVGARSQEIVHARAWRASRMCERGWAPTPAIIDCTDHRLGGPTPPVMHQPRPSDHGHASNPPSQSESPTRALTAGAATPQPVSPDSGGWWSDPPFV